MTDNDRADNAKDERPCHVPKRCTVKYCFNIVPSFRNKCWAHLDESEREEFRKEIVGRVKSESLKGASLYGVDLQEADLSDANLEEAKLSEANLQKAYLDRANLREAYLWKANLQEAALRRANLQNANLGFANLQKADLIRADLRNAKFLGANLEKAYLKGANLQKALLAANLQKADLSNANLQEANLRWAHLQKADLKGANLQKADLTGADLQKAELMGANLQEAQLFGVLLRGAIGLTASQIGKTNEYVAGKWDLGKDVYRRIKNYFHEEGLYEDEGWAFYMEKTCTRKAALKERQVGRWLALSAWNLIAGYGEKWWRAVAWAGGIIAFFGVLFYWSLSPLHVTLSYESADSGSLLTAFYFSMVTFATLGFGDIHPVGRGSMVAVIVEVALGYVMLGTVVALIARKMTR